MTVGILCFVFLEVFALGIPFVSLAACLFFNLGNSIVGELACFCICIYPIFGPYYVLMSNADYRRRFSLIIKKAYGKIRSVKSVGAKMWLSSST
ncbi:unnamed protein product [Auanema sp. JU1783]|nr:unnamed protein product [Auanema sp. JU1783]